MLGEYGLKSTPLVSKENHICPECNKKWKCKEEHNLTTDYLCSKCYNKSKNDHKPITEFGDTK